MAATTETVTPERIGVYATPVHVVSLIVLEESCRAIPPTVIEKFRTPATGVYPVPVPPESVPVNVTPSLASVTPYQGKRVEFFEHQSRITHASAEWMDSERTKHRARKGLLPLKNMSPADTIRLMDARAASAPAVSRNSSTSWSCQGFFAAVCANRLLAMLLSSFRHVLPEQFYRTFVILIMDDTQRRIKVRDPRLS